MDLVEQTASADFLGVFEIGRGGIRILRGTMAHDQQGGSGLGGYRHRRKHAANVSQCKGA
jgi:hypothetical protein